MGRFARVLLASFVATALTVSGIAVPAAGATADPFTVTVDGSLNLPGGDSVNDAVDVHVTAAEALTVDVELVDGAGETVRELGAGLALTDAEADGTFTVSVAVDVEGLDAGRYTVRARQSDDPDAAAEAGLAVAPTAAAQLSLDSSSPDVFPHADGYRDTVTFTAAVAGASAEALPVRGTLTVTSGSTVVETWSIDTSTEQSFTWDGLSDGAVVAGTYTVTASVTTADGTVLTDSTTVDVRRTEVESITVTPDGGSAPAKDGYRDNVTYTVSAVTSTGSTLPVTGSLTISLGGTVAKTWALTDTAAKKFVWDGRIDGKLVPGKFTVTVTAAGPEGGGRTSSFGMTVYAKSLVTIGATARDGATVQSILADPGWGGTPSRKATQWYLDGKPIAGATKWAIPATSAMVGHELTVKVTATVAGVQRVGTSEPVVVQPGKTSEASLRSKLDSLIRTLPGDYTVTVREIDGGKRSVSINGTADREPASSIKIFIAWAVYKKVDQGTLSLSTRLSSGLTVEQCLRAMIEPSDNFCAIELRNKVGLAYLNKLIDDGGYDDTHFWYANGRTKVTSSTDLSDLITNLVLGKLLSHASTAKLVHLLKTQVWREAIPPGLPDDVVQASKPGTLWVSSGMTETDVAFVWGSKTRYAIAVMGYNGATIPSITKISKLVYTHLQGSFPNPFLYDRQQMVSTAGVTLRSTAAASGKVVATYPAGTQIEVIDSIRNWYYVRVAGKLGYMLNTSLTLRNPIG
ncbi:serine hydrolase [Lysobacter korlensis]|uniref:beta-lactamase n=1 Tax=Lysobacter korlensis TaxID=553636 RepID=A0ABV6RXW8_9GAMM